MKTKCAIIGSGNIGDEIIMDACQEVFAPHLDASYVSTSR